MLSLTVWPLSPVFVTLHGISALSNRLRITNRIRFAAIAMFPLRGIRNGPVPPHLCSMLMQLG